MYYCFCNHQREAFASTTSQPTPAWPRDAQPAIVTAANSVIGDSVQKSFRGDDGGNGCFMVDWQAAVLYSLLERGGKEGPYLKAEIFWTKTLTCSRFAACRMIPVSWRRKNKKEKQEGEFHRKQRLS